MKVKMKLSKQHINEFVRQAAIKALVKESALDVCESGGEYGTDDRRYELALKYASALSNNPYAGDMSSDEGMKSTIEALETCRYADELSEAELRRVEDIILKYGTEFDDDIVHDCQMLARKLRMGFW